MNILNQLVNGLLIIQDGIYYVDEKSGHWIMKI